ncbi:potassium voltage-gated channel protein Shab isoform X2 [Folsomia candida]|uniref:Potassium voltage-gated channel subfamily V member 1 n=1 Tax=Folsomia candida TaxID=158441 RepID=A0A226DRU4_FOLCA|nr:potassium voltage-gated channel protein Shab isoform X2 [Folsomia candida]OXA47933.1 Potassium voltage-gated channel protein Shab [Folsomia candida]
MFHSQLIMDRTPGEHDCLMPTNLSKGKTSEIVTPVGPNSNLAGIKQPHPPPYAGAPFNQTESNPVPGEIQSSMIQKPRRVILNVGGDRHEILWDNLARYPYTRLGQLGERYRSLGENRKVDYSSDDEILNLCDDYNLTANEYFWDRQPRTFPFILNLYRRGKLHFPEDLCVLEFDEDLQYWGIDELYLDSCCQIKFQQKKEQLIAEIKKDEEFLSSHKEEDFGKGMISGMRKYLWNMFEKSSTLPQKITGMLSIIIIVLSILTLSLSTVPELQVFKCKHDNESFCEDLLASDDNPSPGQHFILTDNEILETLEMVCIIWFTAEYLIRLFAAPSKRKFFCGVLNNIDLLAIAPFYVSLFLVQLDTPGRLVQVLRVIRILRIFKLARHSIGLQSLGFTLRHSYKGLGVLFLFLSIGVVIFSTLAYFAEREDNSEGFGSIPQTFYWAFITMSTVGYGDVTPKTTFGKVISVITGVCGIVVIALPIPIVVNNFGLFYEEQKRQEKSVKRQKALQELKDTENSNSWKGSYMKIRIVDPLGLDEKKGKIEEK